MGVPKFYRWTSERYPCLSEVVREYQIPEFDNLYLDMNGIIHLCSHPNDDDPHFRISEEKIFKDIFHYIETLFKIIKPKKVFFMAVDGVAPRAKMNQQRGRRFRSAREAEQSEKKAIERGEILPQEERFDSNCITPGTVFMAKLHEQLKYFVTMKVSQDQMWQNIRIYLSGHETPGEGEHKIMEFIRYEKNKPDYDPNTRHCLYGLDADLMMLGLCSHETHFSLLREEVQFCGKKAQKRTPTPEETTFHLLHLSLMRDYIDHEFSSLKGKLKFEYNIEKIIDDWILMGFLVGNDFIPHLPHMHIAHDALPMLYKAYIEILPALDGYINENGYLNLSRFEKYLKQVSQFDYEKFNDTYADLRWYESKNGKSKSVSANEDKPNRLKKNSKNSDNIFDALSNIDDDDFQDESSTDFSGLDKDMSLLNLDSSLDEDDDDKVDDLFELEFQHHKRDYYINKLEYANVTTEVLKDQTQCYIHAIQWNLHYYYHGVCSWSWYYPHHYAPYISDVKDFANLTITFDMGKPFMPFEQLLAVLPSASKKLLPAAYQDLMSEQNSPLIDYYPVDFKTDLNGKQQDWEAVVLIPFINEKRLLEAMKPLEDKLTAEEKNRNKHGPCLLYTYIKERQPCYASSLPGLLPDIEFNHSRCQEISPEEFFIERSKLKNLTNRLSDVFYPGFPSLRYIEHTAVLKKAEVRVFQMVSHKESMILQITPNENNYNLKKIAKECIGQCIQVGWPHFIEAKVVAVADDTCKFSLIDSTEEKINSQDLHEEKFNEREKDIWLKECEAVRQYYYGRLGIDLGYTQILVYASPLIGRRFVSTSSGKLTLEKQWTLNPLKYPFQTTVKNLTVYESLPTPTENIKDLFSPQLTFFMLENPYYGCMGKTLDVNKRHKTKILVELTILKEPDMEIISKNSHSLSLNYMKGYTIAQKLGISSLLLSRITGTFYVLAGSREAPSQINIGLNLKFNKRNKEVPGYTKKTDEGWLYSTNSLHLLTEYIETFPELFDYIAHHTDDSTVHINDIFCNGDSEEKIKEIQNWLKSHPYTKIQHQQCGTDVIEEPVVQMIEEAVSKVKAINQKLKTVRKLVCTQSMYVPSHVIGTFIPDPHATYKLLDRVVVVRHGYSVPLGFRGTIIGIHNAEKDLDSMYDIVFDEEFLGGLSLRCSPNKGYRLPCFALINLTHGSRQELYSSKLIQKPTAVVHPQAPLYNNNSFLENIHVHSKKNNNLQNSMKVLSSKKTRLPLNKINHSPNSPFVSQQVISNTKDTKDYNKKPVRNTNDQFSYHIQERTQVNNNDDNEFILLWKALQEKSIDSSSNNPNQTKNKDSSDLNNAAKRLQSQSFSENHHHWKKNKKNFDTSVNNLEYSHRDQNAANHSIFVSDPRSQIEHPSSRKANLKQPVEHPSSEDDVEKIGKTVLSRLLQIDNGKTNENLNNNHQGAKTKNKVSSHMSKEIKDSNSVSYPFQQSELNYSYQQSKSHYYSASWELLKLVQTLYPGAVPLYSYMRSGPNQVIFAEVKLPDDRCYYGHGCCTKEEAGESAALFALNELKKNCSFPVMANYNIPQVLTSGLPVQLQFPPPPFSSGPSNAFVPNNVPSMLRHPPPQAWLQQQSVGNAWLNTYGNASIDQNHSLQLAYNQDFYMRKSDSRDYYEKQQPIPQSPNKSNQGASSSQKNFSFDPHLIPMQVTKRNRQLIKLHSVPGNTETAAKQEQISIANDKNSDSCKSISTKIESSSKQVGLSESHTKVKKRSRLAITFENDLQDK